MAAGRPHYYVCDRAAAGALPRIVTPHRNEVDWFLALVPRPRRFVVLHGRDAYLKWRRRMRLRGVGISGTRSTGGRR